MWPNAKHLHTHVKYFAEFCHLLITFANCLGPDQTEKIFFQPDLEPNCLTLWGYSWKNFGEEAYTANAYHTSSTSMRLSSLSALYFLGHVTWQNICKTKKKRWYMLTNWRRYLWRKAWFYIHYPHPYKMTTLIYVNELEEVPLRTIAAVLNSLYPPPPPPPTHTHKTTTLIHVSNRRRYL